MAAPNVSGIVTLLKGYNSSLDNDDIEQIIRISADEVAGMAGQDWTTEYGTGRVNARTALERLNPPNELHHWTAYGGTQGSGTSQYLHTFYGVPGLEDGLYHVRRYPVTKTINLPSNFMKTPHAWGRGVATTGFSVENPNFGMGYCEVVAVTSTWITLRTYVYRVWNWATNEYYGYYPTTPNNTVFAYSAWGIHTVTPPPENLSINNNNNSPEIIWEPINVDPLHFDSYKVYRKIGSGSWTLEATLASNETSYLDNEIVFSNKSGEYIQYYVTSEVGGNESTPSETVSLWGDPLWKELVNEASQFPDEYTLHAAYPNPFNPTTSIRFDLPERSKVAMVIYDVIGREITTLIQNTIEPGFHETHWNGQDHTGKPVSAGIYICRFTGVSEESEKRTDKSIKLVLMK